MFSLFVLEERHSARIMVNQLLYVSAQYLKIR